MRATAAAGRRAEEANARDAGDGPPGPRGARPAPGRKSILLFSRGFIEDSATRPQPRRGGARDEHRRVFRRRPRVHVQPGQSSAAVPARRTRPSSAGAASRRGSWSRRGRRAGRRDGRHLDPQYERPRAGAARVAGESREYYIVGFDPRSDKTPADWRKLNVGVLATGPHRPRAPRIHGARGDGGRRPRGAAPGVDTLPGGDTGGPRLRPRGDGDPGARANLRPRPAGEGPHARPGRSRVRRERAHVRGPRIAGGAARGRRGRDAARHREHLGIPRAGRGARSAGRGGGVAVGGARVRASPRSVPGPRGHPGPADGSDGRDRPADRGAGPDGLRFTTPILTDRVERDAKSPAGRHRDRSHLPSWRPGLLRVRGTRRRGEPRPARPRVTAGVEVRTADGRMVRKGDPTWIVADREDASSGSSESTSTGWRRATTKSSWTCATRCRRCDRRHEPFALRSLQTESANGGQAP